MPNRVASNRPSIRCQRWSTSAQNPMLRWGKPSMAKYPPREQVGSEQRPLTEALLENGTPHSYSAAGGRCRRTDGRSRLRHDRRSTRHVGRRVRRTYLSLLQRILSGPIPCGSRGLHPRATAARRLRTFAFSSGDRILSGAGGKQPEESRSSNESRRILDQLYPADDRDRA